MTPPEQPARRAGSPPRLTDGVVVLRPWREKDIDAAVAGHDEEIAHWFGWPGRTPTWQDHKRAVDRWHAAYADDRRVVAFVIEHDQEVVGSIEVRDVGEDTGRLSWVLYAGHRGQGLATRAARLACDWVLTELGMTRVEARVEPGNIRGIRVATRAGMRREGVRRVSPGSGDRNETTEYVYLARLATDPPLERPESFRALLNSFLPRKRAIAQLLVTDPAGRVLVCQLTYKSDWDLPGGVVEVGESPQLAVAREVEEELGIDVAAGDLLLTDWLPPWSGWDDAICLVFDGGVHGASIVEGAVLQAREIRSARFSSLEEVRARCADFTARRVEAALANRSDDGRSSGPAYTESGRGTGAEG